MIALRALRCHERLHSRCERRLRSPWRPQPTRDQGSPRQGLQARLPPVRGVPQRRPQAEDPQVPPRPQDRPVGPARSASPTRTPCGAQHPGHDPADPGRGAHEHRPARSAGRMQIQMIQALAAMRATGIQVPPEAMWLLERETPRGCPQGHRRVRERPRQPGRGEILRGVRHLHGRPGAISPAAGSSLPASL